MCSSNGRFSSPLTFFFFFENSATLEVYYYREQDIFLMTDEEGNKGTETWPSAKNIVRLVPPGSH
jgi:hypothetical protein